MARVARHIDPGKIRKLQERITDPAYIDDAVDILAGRMTERLLDTDHDTDSATPSVRTYRLANSSKREIAEFLRPRE
jgi:hypothetical protein